MKSLTTLIAIFAVSFSIHADQLDVIDHTGMNHSEFTDQFINSYKTDNRRHTFIQLFDNVNNIGIGTFGYHVSEFGTNHQHQLIVRADNLIVGKTLEQSIPLIKGVFSKRPVNKFYSVTSDGPKEGFTPFLLREVIALERTEFPTNLFDGIIGSGTVVKKPWIYKIKERVFVTPMLAKDTILNDNIYIVFGLNDDKAAKTKYFMAHLMWGAQNNFDHLIEVEFTTKEAIPNGEMMVILKQPITTPLEVNKTYEGQIRQEGVLKFKVTKQIRKVMLNANLPK